VNVDFAILDRIGDQHKTAQAGNGFTISSRLNILPGIPRGRLPQKAGIGSGDTSPYVDGASARFGNLAQAKMCRLRSPNQGKPACAPDVSGASHPNEYTTEELPAAGTATNSNQELLTALMNSKIFTEYERAFAGATGLSVALRPVESLSVPLNVERNAAPFCALITQKTQSCAACLKAHARLLEAATLHAHTAACYAGLSQTAVPVRVGDQLIGFLKTTQTFYKKPDERQFQRALRTLVGLGVDPDQDQLRKAYFATRVIERARHASAIKLLGIFAEHLSILSNRIVIRRNNAEPPWLTKAKAFIRENFTENLRLAQVAKIANMSRFHFCKMFRQATALNYTDYLSRIRIEASKGLLVNPNLRVSEVAFESGFQSMSHFNRVFLRVVGQSPTNFRLQLWEWEKSASQFSPGARNPCPES